MERQLEAELTQLNGKLKARLEVGTEGPSKEEELVELINARIRPPRPVKKGEVYIRAMYIVSDTVNSYGGRFPAEEHQRIAELLVDTPVMIGHSKEKLPVARNFHAVVERNTTSTEPEPTSWVKVYFYWATGTKEGEDLKTNIDSGIYKECSVSFSFTTPECSICGEDIRECNHIPFRKYRTSSGEVRTAYFNYRGIQKILETSLVYRGAIPNTRITRELDYFSLHADLGQKQGGEVDQEEVTKLRLTFAVNGKRIQFLLPPDYERKSEEGRSFLADLCVEGGGDQRSSKSSIENVALSTKEVSPVRVERDLMDMEFHSANIKGHFRFRKVILNKRFRWMFYRLRSEDEK